MSKQQGQPQFQSGLNQSFQGLSLSGGSPAASPVSPARHKMTIEYQELKFGASKGKGAYGEVFEGQFRKETVAIKVYDFKGQLSEEDQKEISHEAELMEGLRSKFLVGYRGICWDPRYCLVMEYCSGGTLRGRLSKTNQAIDPLDRFRWAQQISYGIYNLHSVRILHRDLKGENVLLDKHGDAKVADFGLSVVKSSSASQSKAGGGHQVAGTMPWMAPELFEGNAHQTGSDVYSLGMVLWEIASRKLPFAGKMPAVIIGMVLSGKREVIESHWPLVFRTLIQACWDADPAKRPTAEKVGDEFDTALKALESVDRPVSPAAPTAVVPRLDRGTQKSSEKPLDPADDPAIKSRERDDGASPVRPSQIPQSLMPAPKPVVDTKALGQLLKLVAEGEQDQAEALIQSNKQLLLASGSVTDLSGRTFQKITAFQYALWALDWHMWTMIKKYLPSAAQATQLQMLETKGTEYGKHYDIKPLTSALQTYVDNADKVWKNGLRAIDPWNKVVGGAQKLLPVHVVNEYARSDRPFEPCPTEWESKLPRTREIEVWDKLDYVKGSWFIAPSSKESLGTTFAFCRSSHEPGAMGTGGQLHVRAHVCASDLKALQSLWKARTQQLEALKAELLSPAPSYSASSLGAK